MNLRTKIIVSAQSVAAIAGLAAGPVRAQAQSADAADAQSSVALQEVVVTARKVQERVQDVPASIATLGSDALADANINSLVDIGHAVPGVNIVSQAPGRNRIVMRGLSGSGGALVGYYIDDSPITVGIPISQGASDPGIFDLARVEVLRGPQGTLYGASSMGGTIKYITNQPNLNRFSGSTRLKGSFTELGGGNYEVNQVLNAPLVDGVLAVRASGFYRNNSGFLDRYQIDPTNYLKIQPNAVSRDVNTEKTGGGRVVVKYQPTDYLTITPGFFFQNMKLGGDFTFDYPIGSFDNPIQARNMAEPSTDRLRMYTLGIQGNVESWTFSSSTTYYKRRGASITDESKEAFYFGAPAQTTVYPTPWVYSLPQNSLTEELRAAFNFDRISGVVGVYYDRTTGTSAYDWQIPAGYTAKFGDLWAGETSFFYGGVAQHDVQKALFGEVNISITDQLKATLGGRQFKQSQKQGILSGGFLNGGVVNVVGTAGSTGFSPKVGLSYAVDPDLMVYTSASKGFRKGGPTQPVPTDLCAEDLAALGLTDIPKSYRPDTLWNYEFGVKSQWLDRRLTLNSAVYQIDWKGLQQLVGLPKCTYNFVANYGEARSRGVEFEARYEPFESLSIGFQTAYNKSELTEQAAGTNGVVGQTLPYAPKWSGSVSTEYKRQVSANTLLSGRLDFNSTAEQYRSFRTQSVSYRQPGYSLLNARVGLEYDKWELALVASNVLDKRASTGPGSSDALVLPGAYRASMNRPRTIGLEFDLRY